MNTNFYLRIAGLGVTLVIVLFLVEASPISSYISDVRSGAAEPIFFYDQGEAKLRAEIRKQAKAKSQPAIDARADRVWMAVPGYNGVVVDEEATFRKTWSQKKHTPIQWVLKEQQPKINLEKLDKLPIYRGNEHKKVVALMVNVAWGTEYLPGMLDVLKKEKVKGTFFLDGSWLKKHPQEAKRLQQAGHEIGNHAYSHPLMSQISKDRMDKEIIKTEALMQKILRHKSKWFAPPAGDFNQSVIDVADQHQMKTVLWTVDTVDWKKSTSVNNMVRKIDQNVGNGSLILTHPTDRTLLAFSTIIRTVKKKGLQLGTVSDVLSSQRKIR